MATFELDAFYLMLANSIIAFPKARESINELYQTQRFRFYEAATENKYYDYYLMQSKPLELEVSMKQAYGILLCSHDDKQLQDKIIAEIYKIYPPIKKHLDHFSVKSASNAIMDYMRFCNTNHFGPSAKNAFFYFITYILFCKYGFDTMEDELRSLYKIIADDIDVWKNQSYSELPNQIDRVRAKELISVTRNQRMLIERIQTGTDLAELIGATECLIHGGTSYPIKTVSTELFSMLKNINEDCKTEITELWIYFSLLNIMFKLHNVSVSELFSILNIDKMERDRTLKVVAEALGYYDGKTGTPLYLSYYLVALLFGQFAKSFKDYRDFYFKNNSETQFNELQKLNDANAALKEQIADLSDIRQQQQQHIDALNSRIESLSTELSKDTKDAMRPLLGEISLLRSQITVLQNELDSEREKATELNRLREFVFSLQSGQDIPTKKTPLGDLITGKKIYIFGGHINWRNKMKAAYPVLNILDGHNESFDEQLLLTADMVLLNTSNMSHALYYKVIDVLRKNKIPFDYIGKYNNIELMEQEIAEALQKKSST